MLLNTPNYGSSKSNDHRFKILTFLKTRDKTTSNKKNQPPTPPYGGSWGGEGSNTKKSTLELHPSYFKLNSTKTNDQIFKKLAFLKN